MAEARAGERAAEAQATTSTTSTTSARPAGWGEVETSQQGDDLVIAMPAPGLDPDSIHLEPEGSSLKLHARGSGSHGEHISLNETLSLPEGSDPSPATVSYTDGRLVIRIPKSALKTGG
jgi:HSP20 family molecular chaperone IbpA